MCDYSVRNVVVRPARIGDRIITALLIAEGRGFAAIEDPNIAVCMAAGTELKFDKLIEYDPMLSDVPRKLRYIRARFWQITDRKTDRDALHLKDSFIVPLRILSLGQCATVVKLPVMTQPKPCAHGGKCYGT
jgi:hypothetical protein